MNDKYNFPKLLLNSTYIILVLIFCHLISYTSVLKSAFLVVYLKKEQVAPACGKNSSSGLYSVNTYKDNSFEINRSKGRFIKCRFLDKTSAVKIDNYPSIVLPAMYQLRGSSLFGDSKPAWRKNVNDKLSFYINSHITYKKKYDFIDEITFEIGAPVLVTNTLRKKIPVHSCKSVSLTNQLNYAHSLRVDNYQYFAVSVDHISKDKLNFTSFANNITKSISCALNSKEFKAEFDFMLANSMKNKIEKSYKDMKNNEDSWE